MQYLTREAAVDAVENGYTESFGGEHKRLMSDGTCKWCFRDTGGEGADRRPEPTAEQLEQTITEQSARLPPWWDDSEALAKQDRPPVHVAGIRVIRLRASCRRPGPWCW